MTKLNALRTKIFADGADKASMLEMYANPTIQGFTTNPTLMRKAGIIDYEAFAKDIIKHIPDRPISFEVFSDDLGEMKEQAMYMSTWGEHVYVKIPVTNSQGQSTAKLVHYLASQGVKQNVTALMTLDQVAEMTTALRDGPSAYISVFAGRVADTGVDPLPLMQESVQLMSVAPQLELIWASPRELLNLFHAEAVGCHIITATHDILKKLSLIGKNLHEYSLETVQMFRDDALKAGFSLAIDEKMVG